MDLDHEKFEAAKTLAEIGTKIAAGRAALTELESGKGDFLDKRAQETVAKVKEVLEHSKDLLAEFGGYHNELVGYRNELDAFLAEILYLLQSVERWKAEFDAEVGDKNRQIDRKIAQNKDILAEIKGQRALLAGETEGIKSKREHLRTEALKIKDEWETLGRTKEEIKQKK